MTIDLNCLVKTFINSLCGPMDPNNPFGSDVVTFIAINNLISGNWRPVTNTLGPMKSYLNNCGQFATPEQGHEVILTMLQEAVKCLTLDMKINLFIGTNAKDDSDPLNTCLMVTNKYLGQVFDTYMNYEVSNGDLFADHLHSILRDLCKECHAAFIDAFSTSDNAFEFLKLILNVAADRLSGSMDANADKSKMFCQMMIQLYAKLVSESDDDKNVAD